jgi:hypothetical protein
MLIINDVNLQLQNHHVYTVRNLNKYSIEDFKMRLSCESCDSIFDNNVCTDVDSLFNSFLNNYLRIFTTSFPNKRITKKSTNNTWITTGIKISCNHKRYLYLLTRSTDDPNLKNHCKIVAKAIKETKRTIYNNQITNSTNKLKATWNIVNAETNRLHRPATNKHQNSPDIFNTHFLSLADKITHDIRYKNSKGCKTYKSPTHYLANLFHKHFPSIKFNNTSTKETEKIIKYLHLKKSCSYDGISTKIL